MSRGISLEARYRDISNRTGLSVEVVKRVMTARSESIIDDLKKGKTVIDYGICKLIPELADSLDLGHVVKKKIVVKAKPSVSLTTLLGEMSCFEVDDDSINDIDGILVNTLSWQQD